MNSTQADNQMRQLKKSHVSDIETKEERTSKERVWIIHDVESSLLKAAVSAREVPKTASRMLLETAESNVAASEIKLVTRVPGGGGGSVSLHCYL
jgi:hypothetical protein